MNNIIAVNSLLVASDFVYLNRKQNHVISYFPCYKNILSYFNKKPHCFLICSHFNMLLMLLSVNAHLFCVPASCTFSHNFYKTATES